MGSRRRFSREYKFEAVSMLQGGRRNLVEVARELGLRPDMLRKWKKQVDEDGDSAFPGSGNRPVGNEELERLRREHRRLREELEILRKAAAIISESRQR